MSASIRTLEERIKFDHGLSVGTHVVKFSFGRRFRPAVVRISPRGVVHCLAKPLPNQMYSSWQRIRGDNMKPDLGVIVWAAQNPEVIGMFDADISADITAKSIG